MTVAETWTKPQIAALIGSVQVKVDDLRVCKFAVEAKQGGTVELRFQLQSRPNEEQIGKLCSLMDREVSLCLVPPGAEFAPLLEAA